MKLSTRLKKYVAPTLLFGDSKYSNPDGDYTALKIVLMVNCERTGLETYSLEMADEYHRHLIKDEKCALLPLRECPVVNSLGECIMHYTSTNYRDWCNS